MSGDNEWKQFRNTKYYANRDGVILGHFKNPLTGGISRGYSIMIMCVNKKRTTIGMHRVICEVFNGPPPSGKYEVNHINGIKTDNRLINLEWVSPKENVAHAYKIGLVNMLGSNHHQSKLEEYEVLHIRDSIKNKTLTRAQAAKLFKVSKSTIGDIITRKSWRHI